MKKLLKGILSFHILPLTLALGLILIIDSFLSTIKVQKVQDKTISGTSTAFGQTIENCATTQSQIELIGSLQNKDVLTIFGSSELQSLPYSSYFFLPDTLGMKTVAFGHAFHQNLSIACELLAAGDALEGANVCVILSPGWFQTDGTNIEAFLEFVRPEFLKSIINDSSIPVMEKLHVAEFVAKEYKNIDAPSFELSYLNAFYLSKNCAIFPKSLTQIKPLINNVIYQVENSQPVSKKRDLHSFNWQSTKERLQKEAINSCSNNSIYVDSAYFEEYLKKDGTFKKSSIAPIMIGKEYEDFQLVVSILKRKHCKATFILQPLNPYYYDNLENFNPLISKIHHELNQANFPFCNFFVSSTKDYTPGFLKDIMHPSNLGWLEINRFLAKIYTHEK